MKEKHINVFWIKLYFSANSYGDNNNTLDRVEYVTVAPRKHNHHPFPCHQQEQSQLHQTQHNHQQQQQQQQHQQLQNQMESSAYNNSSNEKKSRSSSTNLVGTFRVNNGKYTFPFWLKKNQYEEFLSLNI